MSDGVPSAVLEYLFEFLPEQSNLSYVNQLWHQCWCHQWCRKEYGNINITNTERMTSNIYIVTQRIRALYKYEAEVLQVKSIITKIDFNKIANNDIVILHKNIYKIRGYVSIENKKFKIIGLKGVVIDIHSMHIVNSDLVFDNLHFEGDSDDEYLLMINHSKLELIKCTFCVIGRLTSILTHSSSILIAIRSVFLQELNGINIDHSTEKVEIIECHFKQILSMCPRIACIDIMDFSWMFDNNDNDHNNISTALEIKITNNRFDHNQSWVIACDNKDTLKLNLYGNKFEGVNEPLYINNTIINDQYFIKYTNKLILIKDWNSYWEKYTRH